MPVKTNERLHLLPSEINALLKACKSNHSGLRDKVAITLMYHHGLRVSELVTLRWSDIDFDTASVFIRRAKGSNDGTHSIPGDELRLLRKYKLISKGIYVIANAYKPNMPVQRAAINKKIKGLAFQAGITINIHPHMFRHSCGFYLASKGVPLREIQIYLGHKNVQNTVHYTWMNPNTSRNYFE